MNNQSGMNNQNELDITNLKYQMEIINGLSNEIDHSLEFLLPQHIIEVAGHNRQAAKTLATITNVFPAVYQLMIDLQRQINELPEFIEVPDDLSN